MRFWHIRQTLRWIKPYRGWFAWETQLGPLVFQLIHRKHAALPTHHGVRLGRLVIWHDRFWR